MQGQRVAAQTAIVACFLVASVAPIGPLAALGNALDIVMVGKDVVVALAKTWNIVDDHFDFSEAPTPFIGQTEKRLMRKVDFVYRQLLKLNTEISSVGMETISNFMRTLPDEIKLELRLNDFLDYTTRVNVFYKNMQLYVNQTDHFERHTLEDFALSVISHDGGSVKSLLERIHAFVLPQGVGIINTGILSLISQTIKEMPNDVSHGLDMLESVWVWARAYSELRGVHALYEGFRRFQKLQSGAGRIPSPERAWLDLTETILNDRASVPVAFNHLDELVVKERLFKEVAKEVEGDMQCSINQSPQQVLYNLYNSIALTELKGYMMMQFSYMLLKLYSKGNFTKEAQTLRDQYQQRQATTIAAVKYAMESASREYWKCDPKKHIKGETYEEITQLIQGYIQNEVDLNPEGTCRETCAEYQYTKSHDCYKNLYCQQQRRCNGKIVNCQYFDADMWVCPASPFSGRRYEYVEFESGRTFGRKQECSKGTIKVDSWWRWLFWHCSYCFCFCDESGPNSDRYFNMMAVTADIKNNRVVTGLRFVKHNRIIHLQVQEGQLLPRGNIDPTTVRWVPVRDYKITDRKVFNGQDFHTLTWEQRALDLDDLVADAGHLLTGVRFKKIGSHLNFEILITPFDFATGQLIEPTTRSVWKDNSNTDASLKNPRKRVELVNPDVPTRSLTPSIPDSKSDQYVEFTHTDLDRDAAQTTVPFLDAQPVESILPVPLSGAGIYHKGRKHFGGFVAPKIITYDYSQHLFIPSVEDEVKSER